MAVEDYWNAEARNDADFLQYSLPPEALDTENWDENNMHTDNAPRGPVECDIRKLIRPRKRQRESRAGPPRQRGLRELNPNLTHTKMGGVLCEAGEAVAELGAGRGTEHGAAGQGEAAAAPGCGHGIAHEGDEAAGDPGCARSVEAAGRGADADAVTADVVADATTDATTDAMTDAMTDDERSIVEQLFDDCVDSEWRDLWVSDYAGCAKCNGYIFRSSDVAGQVCAAALDRVRPLLTCCAPRAHAAWRLLLRHRS